MNQLACCQMPTQVVLVDDDSRFLNATSLKLRRHRAIVQFDNPVTAKNYFENLQPKAKLFAQIATYQEEETRGEGREINFDISRLQEAVYNANRFDTISVAIVDYTMPGLNGVELCQSMPSNIKRILLTGDADEKIAVDAFNRGLIQRYIRKDAEDVGEQIEAAIQELEQRYFYDACEEIVSHLEQDQEHPLHCFLHKGFVDFVQEQFSKYQIVEHYLYDTRGSLLGLDKNGKAIMIVVRDADDMQAAAEIAELSDEAVEEDILNCTKAKKCLLFTGLKDDFSIPPSQWKKYLYPVKFIHDDNYFVAVVEDFDFNLAQKDVLSFNGFLEGFYKK